MNLRRLALAAIAAGLLLAPAAWADPTPQVGGYTAPAAAETWWASGVEQIGFDSVTHQRCAVGESATCQVPVATTGGSGGDASAANQTSQITQATATNTVLGAVSASPTANTIADRLKVINATLGAPLQAGGHVIVDTAPSTAVTGTFWQATQPISAASLPLPSGAMQQTGGTVGLVAGSAVIGHVIVDTAPTTAASESGTWTVQPGNTPNTTPWLANPTQLHPSGATQESCSSGNIAAGVAACTLAASVGKTTFIAGFSMTASGATAALAVNCTLTGVITGTQTYIFTFPIGAAVPATPLVIRFTPPLAASATNTTIVPSCPSGGSGAAHAAMNADGYQE